MLFCIESQELPPVYHRKGKQCYLDPIRQKLIFITPEETVRQRIIAYLIHELKVPKEMIRVEEPLAHYGVDSKRRADVIVHGLDQDDHLRPLAIIECKAPNIYLDEFTGNQLADYCDALSCNYALMTNGDEAFCFYYDEKQDEYIQLDSIPSYADLLDNRYSVSKPMEVPPRLSYDEISEELSEHIDEYFEDISPQTEHDIACAGLNLWEGLLDIRHKFPERAFRLFRVVQDYGVRILSYGNASGGLFSGPYRSLLIEVNGNTEFISFGFSTYGSYSHPEQIKTALNIAIDNERETHHALQFVLDDNVIRNGYRFDFYHHGKIGIGKIGSGRVSELQAFVQKKYPQIIYGKKFYLGSLIYDRDWNVDDPEVVDLLENFISYALIRDEYRHYVKAKSDKRI